MESMLLGLLALVAGLFVGAIGIGGIIQVSGLIYLAGMGAQAAIAVCMFSYLVPGVVGTAMYARAKSIRWSMAAWLCAGAMPGALVGAWAINNTAPLVLELGIGFLTAAAGINALLERGAEVPAERDLAGPVLAAIGLAVGFGSAVTGTGGPLLLVPTLLWLKVPVLTAIGLSQAITMPIAALATTGNLLYGHIDVGLGVLLGAGLGIGTWGGAIVAHLMPRAKLRQLVAVMLTIIGAAIVLRITWRLLAAT